MSEPFVVTSGDAVGPLRSGGKGTHLGELFRAGQNVPPFFVITTEGYRAAIARVEEEIRARLASLTPANVEETAAALQALVRRAAMPEVLSSAISAQLLEMGGGFFAVRSSAVDEDSSGQSFAGLHESFLFVRGDEAVVGAVRKVWASLFTPRALTYRLNSGKVPAQLSIAVVVQRMIDPRSSGVVFTVNPVTENVQEILINSLFGAGEGLVSEGLDADSYVVSKQTMDVRGEIAVKSEAIVQGEQGGVRKIELDFTKRDASSLSEEEAKTVARASMAIEQHFGRPQDIEFAFDNAGQLFILQSRAITTVKEYGPAAGNRLLWDNSNIIESFSGVTSPMTFSVIRRAYAIVYRCFSEVMGIDERKVHDNRYVFENMLGLFRGQVYYNLLNWYRLVRMFPGFEYNRAFMESMMGVRESVTVEEHPRGALHRYFVDLPQLVKLVLRSSFNFLRIRKLVDGFQANFRSHYDRWSKIDLDRLKPHELMNLYLEFEEKVLWSWRPPIINDFFVMIFYGVLKKLTTKWCGDESGSLQNDLISGEGGIESTLPARELLRMAGVASQQPALRDLVVTKSEAEALAAIRSSDEFQSFRRELDHYLDLYGFRCMNELKLEESSLRDRPEFLITLLRNYLTGDPARLDLAAQEAREQDIRRQAEQRAFAAISSPWRRRLFRRVLNNARLGVKNRENMRFARTRIFGLVREVLRAIGRQFAAEGILDDPADVFYLTLDEVFDFIKGTAVTTDLRGLVALRRGEFDRYRASDPPDDRFETFGVAYNRNSFASRRELPPQEPGTLRGTPCSPGVVTRVVKLLRSPAEASLSGEILVAERTDPGWVPLYPSVSGLLIERGSILSHSAIVAREMGIPTIVGIPELTKRVKSGDVVTMDGTTGVVTIPE